MDIIHPRWKIVTPPSELAVSLDAVKLQAKIEINADDENVTDAIESAIKALGNRISRAFVTTTIDYTIDYFPGFALKLPVADVQSVTSITYQDANGNPVVLTPGSSFRVTPGAPGYVYPVIGSTLPITNPNLLGGVVIRFVAGYGTAADVPANVRQAIKILAAHLYKNRDSEIPDALWTSLDSLMDSERWY